MEKNIDDKLNFVVKKMEEVLKHDLPFKASQHFEYHKLMVETNFSNVTCDSVEKLIAMNVALTEKSLSVSMVSFFHMHVLSIYIYMADSFFVRFLYISERYKASKSTNAFINQAYP